MRKNKLIIPEKFNQQKAATEMAKQRLCSCTFKIIDKRIHVHSILW